MEQPEAYNFTKFNIMRLGSRMTIINPSGPEQTRLTPIHSFMIFQALVSQRKWCVTGTPISTLISDLAAQYDFVGLPQLAASFRWPQFAKPYLQPCDTADHERYFRSLYALKHGGVMMRHVHGQHVDGKPILELPPKTERIEHIELNEKEKEAYQKALAYAVGKYQSIPAALRPRQTLQILSILLPLRQLCSGGVQDVPKPTDATTAECMGPLG